MACHATLSTFWSSTPAALRIPWPSLTRAVWRRARGSGVAPSRWEGNSMASLTGRTLGVQYCPCRKNKQGLIFETMNVRYCDKCIRERSRILPEFAMGWCKPLAYGWCIIALLIAIYTYLLVVERRGNFLLLLVGKERIYARPFFRWKAGRDNLGNLWWILPGKLNGLSIEKWNILLNHYWIIESFYIIIQLW